MLGLWTGDGVQERQCLQPTIPLRDRQDFTRLVPGFPFQRTVDPFLWTVPHRTTAQLGLLLFIPALFTEVREESCDLSAGGSHRVYEERRGREELLRRLRQEDCKIGTSLGNNARPCLQNKNKKKPKKTKKPKPTTTTKPNKEKPK